MDGILAYLCVIRGERTPTPFSGSPDIRGDTGNFKTGILYLFADLFHIIVVDMPLADQFDTGQVFHLLGSLDQLIGIAALTIPIQYIPIGAGIKSINIGAETKWGYHLIFLPSFLVWIKRLIIIALNRIENQGTVARTLILS